MKSLLIVLVAAVITSCNNPSKNADNPTNPGGGQPSGEVKDNLTDTSKGSKAGSANPSTDNNLPSGGTGTNPGSTVNPTKVNPNNKGALDDTAQENQIKRGSNSPNNDGTKTGSTTNYDSNNKGGLNDTAQENRNSPTPSGNIKTNAQKIDIGKYSSQKGNLNDTAMERPKPLIKRSVIKN